MPVSVVVTLKTQPGTADAMLAGLKEMLPDTRAFPGCKGVEVTRDLDNPDTLYLLERWEERANHEAYTAWRAERGDFDGLGEALSEPPTFAYSEPQAGV
jgi:quinol monooxygenase YgiN